MILNPDHITIGVADAGPAIEFFALLGFELGEHFAVFGRFGDFFALFFHGFLR